MDDAANRALARLRDPSGKALADLARLVVEEATATPLRDLAKPRWIASQIATALEAASHSDVLKEWVDGKIAEGREAWRSETRTLRAFLPKEAEDPLRKMLERPWTPDEGLTLRIVDQPAVTALVGAVLEDSLTRFAKKLRSLEKGAFGGLGSRAAKRGKGILGGLGQNLGGLTENLVGAIAEEVEASLEGRVRDFVAGANNEAMRVMARYIADPQHGPAFGELRVSTLDVLLDSPISLLASEADKTKPEEMVDVIVGAIRSAVAAPDFVDRTEARVASVLASTGDGTLGAWLDEVGLRDVWTTTTTELVTARLVAVVNKDAFVAWWAALHE